MLKKNVDGKRPNLVLRKLAKELAHFSTYGDVFVSFFVGWPKAQPRSQEVREGVSPNSTICLPRTRNWTLPGGKNVKRCKFFKQAYFWFQIVLLFRVKIWALLVSSFIPTTMQYYQYKSTKAKFKLCWVEWHPYAHHKKHRIRNL